MSSSVTADKDVELDRYLLFYLGDELYGTPLMGVREVVEFQKPKPIPQTVPAFLGVINIRGEIVGVIDLRIRLGYPAAESRAVAMMVFSTASGALATVADRMDGVARIPSEDIERAARIDARLPQQFLVGVGKVRDRLVTLIDLNGVLDQEEVKAIAAAR